MGLIDLREMQIDDYDEISHLWQQTSGIGLSDADSYENIDTFLQRNKGLCFVSLMQDKIVGTILCGQDGRRGYIYHCMVHPECRKSGVAYALIKQSLNTLKRIGIHKCHLFAFENNVDGTNFWSHMGWTKRKDLVIFSKSI
ncbi:MAG: GNAT family N-acetyltransferase [Eubacteriales bacterium]